MPRLWNTFGCPFLPISPSYAGRPQSLRYPPVGPVFLWVRKGETAARSQWYLREEVRLTGPRVPDWTGPSDRTDWGRKVLSVGAARLPQIGGLSYGSYQCQTP